MPTYSVIRHYKNDNFKSKVIKTDLTLEEAKEHCGDPETSSRTATSEEANVETLAFGQWFDGFIED